MDVNIAIKTEYIDSERTVCRACLSANRNTFRLKGLKEIYHKICEIPMEESSNVCLCWECIALLKKIKLFKKKAQNSQKILENGLHKEKSQVSFSSLSFSNTSVTDSFQEIKTEVDILNEIIEIKIKNEPENDDSDNNVDVTDHNQTDEVSEMSCKRLKKRKKLRATKHYKLTYLSCKGNIVKKKAIDANDVPAWVETEKNSVYFKNLKNKCELCFCKLKNKGNLEDHHKRFHVKTQKRPYPCDICQQYQSSKLSLKLHAREHYHSKICGVCGYESYTTANMRDHIGGHKKVVQCLECHATFKNLLVFFRHYKDDHKKYICDYCNKVHIKKRSLEKHIISDHLKTISRCDVCNVIYKNKQRLRRHVAMLHKIDRSEANFCVKCNVQYDNRGLFKRHVQTALAHRSERPTKPKKGEVPCPECCRTYATKFSMMSHYRFVHSKSSKYRCIECDMSFLSSSKLLLHRRTVHEGFVPLKNKICTTCDRGFANNRSLRNHIRTHTGERPYECTFCDSKFAQQTALQTHIKFIHFKAKRK